MNESLLSATKRELVLLMKQHHEITAQEASQETGLAVSTVRQHLSELERDGFVETRFERQGVGRPSKMHKLTRKSDLLFENRDDDVLAMLLDFLDESGAEDQIESFFEEMKGNLIDIDTQECAGLGLEARLEKLVVYFEARGFLVDVQRDEDSGIVIDFLHCPYSQDFLKKWFPCCFEKEVIGRMLGVEVDSAQCNPDSHESCRFVIESRDFEPEHSAGVDPPGGQPGERGRC